MKKGFKPHEPVEVIKTKYGEVVDHDLLVRLLHICNVKIKTIKK